MDLSMPRDTTGLEPAPRMPRIRTRKRMAEWERRHAEWARMMKTIAIIERSMELLTAMEWRS